MSTKKYAVEFSKTVWRIIEVEIEIEEEDHPFVNNHEFAAKWRHESLAEDKAIQVLMDEGVFGDGWEADSVWEVEAPVKDSPHTHTPTHPHTLTPQVGLIPAYSPLQSASLNQGDKHHG